MIIVWLLLLGLCCGSFVNALVWRIHQQSLPKSKRTLSGSELSIVHGRSMCSMCHHPLGVWDLLPLFSWLWLRGRCRYCRRPIADSPWIEALMPLAFVVSYLLWPRTLTGWEWVVFADWLVMLVGLAALLVYDLRWMLLPNRIIFPLIWLQLVFVAAQLVYSAQPLHDAWWTVLATIVGGGLFYALFQLSNGRWIGGGDVKLGFLIGLITMSPVLAGLALFMASLLGTLITGPLVLAGKMTKTTRVPFGPLLIIGCSLSVLLGQRLLDWYVHTVLSIAG